MKRVVLFLLAGWLCNSSIGLAQETTFQPSIGGFPADAGFALGGNVNRTRLVGRTDAHVRGALSIKKYQLYEAGISVPELKRWLALDVTGRYRNLPQEDYWGLGSNTPTTSRSNYLLEDVDTTATLTAYANGFRVGVNGGVVKINTGPGRDQLFPSVPESLQSAPRFTHVGAFMEYETLDQESDPHSGGSYSFQWTSYISSFQRYSIDVRRFIPVSDTDRIGLRLQTLFTQSGAIEEVPFFMLPTVGGSRTVRGFNPYRFRDRHALILNVEYRRPLAGFLDVVAFTDAGRVFSNAADLGLRHLHPSAGGGVRLKFGTSVFVGIDVGFSSESQRLSFRSDHMF